MNLVCDLGTSHFRAAFVGSDKILNEPCVIAYDSRGHTMIGTEAQRMIGRNPSVIEVITPIEGGVIRNLDAAVELIRRCIQQLAPGRFRRKFALTLSIPSGLTQVETRALEDAGRSAGAHKVHFVNAAVASALAAGLPVDSPTGCLVVDLGAGVTEAALLSLNGIVASHQLKYGGQAIDDAIVERVKQDHSFLLGKRSAEECKHQLCSDLTVAGLEVRGRNLRTGLPGGLWIERSLVDEEISTYCDAIINLIGEAISACPPELVGDVVDRGIVLVGGGANIAGLVSQLTVRLSVPVVVAERPETSVIRGLLRAQYRTSNTGRSAFARLPALKGMQAAPQKPQSHALERQDE